MHLSRQIGILLSVLVAGIIVSTLLMLGIYAIPTSLVEKHVHVSAELIGQEGLVAYVIPGYNQSRLDNFTDALMLGEAVFTPYKTLAENAMLNERFSGYDPVSSLLESLDGAAPETEPYARYWHGYLLFLKPLLLFFSIGSIRYLLAITEILLMLLFTVELAKHGKQAVMAFFALLAGLCPPALMNSLHYAPCFMIAIIAGFLVLHSNRSYPVIFLLTGMSTAFIDFLTFPILTLIIPLTVYVLQSRKTHPWILLFPVFAWSLGYAGLWAGKWLVGSILLRRNLFSDALLTLLTRTSAQDVQGYAVPVTAGFTACLRTLITPVTMIACLVSIISLLPSVKTSDHKKRFPLLLTAMMPVLWTLLACNHSLEHAFFAYRTLAASIFPLVLAVSPPKEKAL